MSRAYLYVFTLKNFDRKTVSEYLDTIEDVDTWFYSMPNSMFIVGNTTAKKLSSALIEKFGQHRHFITTVSKKDRAGWMPKKHWALFPKDSEA